MLHIFRLTATLHELADEKQLGKALRNNQQQWQNKISKLEEKYSELKTNHDKEVAELKEQVRDLMFYINAQQVRASITQTNLLITPSVLGD